jgi:hypothetical protein
MRMFDKRAIEELNCGFGADEMVMKVEGSEV